MKRTGVCIIALLGLHVLCMGISYAGDPAVSKIKEELSKQESIYQSKGDQVPEGYTIDRSLQDYIYTFAAEFDRSLANLGPNQRWLDIGAGRGQAVLDYFTSEYDLTHMEGAARRGKKAQAIAMSIEDRRTSQWQQRAASLGESKIQYLFNRRLREYAPEELGKFQLITDLIGGFSYTDQLSAFLERVLGLLELNGSFFTLLQDVHSEVGTNWPFYPGAPFLTEIENGDGSEVRVCAWLKKVNCVEVSCELKMAWKPPIEAYHIRKVCNDVAVPALVPLNYEAGTPPQRKYRLQD